MTSTERRISLFTKAAMRPRRILLLSCFLFAAVTGMLRLNDLSLFTDSTRYVIWATGLSQLNGWIDATMPEPERYVVNAPFYSVLIAPSQWIESFSLTWAKILTLIYGLAALVCCFMWMRDRIGFGPGIAATAAFAVAPLTVVLFTEALSEAPFLLMVFAVLLLMERSYEKELDRRAFAALVAILAFLPLVREIGFVFVAAVIIDLAVRRQWKTSIIITTATTCLLAAWTFRNLVLVGAPATSQSANIQFIFQHVATPEDAPLIQELAQRMWLNVLAYRHELGGMVFFPFPLNLIRGSSGIFLGLVDLLQSVKSFLPLIVLPAIALGTYKDLRTGGTALLRVLFIAGYVLVVLLYPVQDIRFFLPLLPFLLFALARCCEAIMEARPVIGKVLGATALFVLLGANGLATAELVRTNVEYLRLDPGPGTRTMTGFYATPWSSIGEWIQDSTAADAVIASAAKEIAIFTEGRLVLEINRAVPLPTFEALLRDHDVQYLLVPLLRPGVRSYEFHLTESRRFRFEKLIERAGLELFRVHSAIRFPERQAPSTPDTGLSAGALLRRGRGLLLAGSYAAADSSLVIARGLDPGNPEIAFQRLVSGAFAGDLSRTIALQQELFSTPRSTSYLPVGRALLSIAERIDRAAKTRSQETRAQTLFEAGRTSWDLGYSREARAMFSRAAAADPQHFESLLWAAHATFLDGDLKAARTYVSRLEQIDRTNAVVVGFRTIDSLTSLLQRARDRSVVGKLYLEVADVYESVGLPEAALDAAERATTFLETPAMGFGKISEILAAQGKTFGSDRYRLKQ